MIKQKHFFLIRGLTREAAHWGAFLQHLQATFPGCLVTTLDLPGAGVYCKEAAPFTIDEMVERIHQDYLKSQTSESQNILIAKSLGGMVATAWIAKHPGLFSHAVLINTSGAGLSPFHHRLRPTAAWSLLLAGCKVDPRKREQAILKVVLNHPEAIAINLPIALDVCQKRPIMKSNAIRQLLAAARFKSGEAPKVPTLILVSTNDRMVNVECSRAIARSWRVPIVEHPSAGHELSDEAPLWVAHEIRKFISEE